MILWSALLKKVNEDPDGLGESDDFLEENRKCLLLRNATAQSTVDDVYKKAFFDGAQPTNGWVTVPTDTLGNSHGVSEDDGGAAARRMTETLSSTCGVGSVFAMVGDPILLVWDIRSVWSISAQQLDWFRLRKNGLKCSPRTSTGAGNFGCRLLAVG